MIQLHLTDGRFCPRFICDHCQGIIERSGTVLWKCDPDGKVITDGPYSLHKLCTRPFEYARSDRWLWLSEELSVTLAQLVHNTKIDMGKARKHAIAMENIGL